MAAASTPTKPTIVIGRPEPTAYKPQNLCMDKDYEYPQVRELVEAHGYAAHIQARGEEAGATRHVSDSTASGGG